jgi:hypothetical protein
MYTKQINSNCKQKIYDNNDIVFLTQPRLIVLATGRKQRTPIIHIHRCEYDNGSEIGREG